MGKKSSSKKEKKSARKKGLSSDHPEESSPLPITTSSEKKKKTKKKKNKDAPTSTTAAAERIVTMEALEGMSSSDDDEGGMPPEAEWGSDALALKKSINSGAFDQMLQKLKQKDNNDDDDDNNDPFEEAVLDEESDGDDDNDKIEAKQTTKRGKEDEDLVADDTSSSDSSEEEDEREVDGGDDDATDADADLRRDDESDDNEDEDEEEDNDEDIVDTRENELAKKNSLSSKAMHVVTEDLKAEKKGWPWAETFDVVSSEPLPFDRHHHRGGAAATAAADNEDEIVDIHDDLKREVVFYDMALAAVAEARSKCEEASIPFSRPDDFFAEMVKTDEHMAKVKDRLIFEGKKIDAVDQRKSNKEQKLRAKEAHANKLAEKAKRKRDHFKELDDWAQSAASKRGRLLDDDDGGAFGGGGGGRSYKGPNKKRQASDRKFGFGGKRGRFKQNDRKSMGDTSDYNPRGNFPGGMKRTGRGSSAGSSSGGQRKGKRARDAMRSRR